MPVSEAAFRKLALEEPDGHWELHCGVPRQKPSMTFEHNYVVDYLVPMDYIRPHRGRRDELEVYDAPLPLVVEIWSPSTGEFDVTTKLLEYQRRGDLEIWRLHPYERTLIEITVARTLRSIMEGSIPV